MHFKTARKRVQAKPGKVLTSEEEQLAWKLKRKKENKRKRCKKNLSKSKSELTKEIANQFDQNVIPLSLYTNTVSAGDWVRVEHLAKKSKLYFIAQVVESLDTWAHIVKFLKKSLMRNIFIFLNNEEMEI